MIKTSNITSDVSNNARKITPGPYRATKLWNEIVHQFRDGMPCRRHRRHLKMYNSCFPANDAVDFLHEILKSNHNIGKDVTRQQTLQLLRKFLKNHIIEDINGKWGSENLVDDSHLYRFSGHLMPANRQPLSTVNENVNHNRVSKKLKSKIKEPKNKKETKKQESDRESTCSSGSLTPSPARRFSMRPLPPVPQCKVEPRVLTEQEEDKVWKDIVLQRIKKSMNLKSLENLMQTQDINGGWVKHNATKVGKSGVVQVSIDEDLPYWALSAMTCLANWPNGKDTGLPCYRGFEHDVFKAICDFYCYGRSTTKPTNQSNHSDQHIYSSIKTSEPLLTYDLYELFTNILCMARPETKEVAIECLQLCLMLLPPSNRRKLHLLLRLMAKVSGNPHLTNMSKNMPTRVLLLHTFSRHILSCFEEVYLDELLAMRLVTFLIDHHKDVMEVPTGLVDRVNEKLERLRRPVIRYGDGDNEGSFVQYSYFPGTNTKLAHVEILSRSKSVEAIKSLTTGPRAKFNDGDVKEKSKHRRSVTLTYTEEEAQPATRARHRRSSTISTKMFNLRAKSKNPLKPAQSCPDITDRLTPPSPPTLPPKTFSSSSRNIKSLINKLRRNRS
nr:DEP domain-containing protein 1A-like [Ciona intestinalis]|eukprot:XP_002120611.1 DEP domain-containing protein 1A-like [Ciona intestinalis]